MSPEQIEGDPVDLRSDIYSLGIMAYEMFTGVKPFIADDLMEVIDMQTNTDIPDPSLLVPDLPEAIKNCILKACSKSPDKRYNSMHEIINEMSSILKTLKQGVVTQADMEKEITVLLISHDKDQSLAVNKLLGEFSQRAEEKGFSLNIAGKTRIT